MTSQVLANIYLHEFDFFVRHYLKPLAYIRYGDDFLLFASTKKDATDFKQFGTQFLESKLKLPLHARNNLVLPVQRGVRFLGVLHYPNSHTLTSKMFDHIQSKLTLTNHTSYINYVEKYGSRKQKMLIKPH